MTEGKRRGRRFGARPRPRVLVVNAESELALAEKLKAVAPTVEHATSERFAERINPIDWDAIVLWNVSTPVIPESVAVLQFGGSGIGAFDAFQNRCNGYTTVEASKTYDTPDDLHPALVAPAEALAEQLAGLDQARVMQVDHDLSGVIVPVVTNVNGSVAAGFYRRGERDILGWWWLPDDVERPEKWVAAVLAFWADRDDRFEPEIVTIWTADPKWQTADERGLAGAVDELDAAHAEAVARYKAERAELEARRAEATERADVGERRLLTAQSNELKKEVAAALAEMGFEVENADEERAKKGDLLEDLRIVDPAAGGWIALAEVRGHAKRNAQVGALADIERFVGRYGIAEGKPPDAKWYVINQSFVTDPGKRQLALASNPHELKKFADDRGLVLDTRDLFLLRERVRAGLDPEVARKLLREGRGRFALPDEG